MCPPHPQRDMRGVLGAPMPQTSPPSPILVGDSTVPQQQGHDCQPQGHLPRPPPPHTARQPCRDQGQGSMP